MIFSCENFALRILFSVRCRLASRILYDPNAPEWAKERALNPPWLELLVLEDEKVRDGM